MDRHYFNPTPDTIYTNKGGGSYICLEAEGHFRAKFQRVSTSGRLWLTAVRCMRTAQ